MADRPRRARRFSVNRLAEEGEVAAADGVVQIPGIGMRARSEFEIGFAAHHRRRCPGAAVFVLHDDDLRIELIVIRQNNVEEREQSARIIDEVVGSAAEDALGDDRAAAAVEMDER